MPSELNCFALVESDQKDGARQGLEPLDTPTKQDPQLPPQIQAAQSAKNMLSTPAQHPSSEGEQGQDQSLAPLLAIRHHLC